MPFRLLKYLSTAPLWITLTVFTAVITVGLDSGATVAQTTETDRQEIEATNLAIDSDQAENPQVLLEYVLKV